jgi:hypothetical protein
MKYASFLVISRALHLNVFDQPVKNHLFNNLLKNFPSLDGQGGGGGWNGPPPSREESLYAAAVKLQEFQVHIEYIFQHCQF